MSALDDIRQRAEVAMDYPGHVTILESQTDIPRLLGALDAVLALHTEDEQGKCAECTVAPFSVHSVKWPCPTVVAVHDALEGK